MSEAALDHRHDAPGGPHDGSGWEAALNRVQRPALLIGGIGLLLTIIGLIIDPADQFRAYLWAFVYWIAIPLGSLALLMLQHMTGGTWGLAMRRFLEASSWLLILMLIFAVPLIIAVAFRLDALYPWLPHGDKPGQFGHAPANPAHNAFKEMWLAPSFFILRTLIYFGIWIGLAVYLYAWSGREDRVGSTPKSAFAARVVSAPGILLFGLTSTFAAIDWVMSIDPAWYSTMFGVLFLVGQGLATMAFTIAIISLLAERRPLRDILSPGLLNDLGNLMFAFLMLWAYTNFSQFLIMWSGNIAEETPYYHFRNRGSWGAVALFLVIFHFFAPFLLLLWRRVKRDIKTLALVAIAILIVRSVDLYWIVKPMFFQRTVWLAHGTDANADAPHDGTANAAATQAAAGQKEHPDTHDKAVGAHDAEPHVPSVFAGMNWTDLPAIAGIGGIWVAAFVWKLKQRPVLPPNDPRLAALAHAHH